jgi:flagellar FliL protein
MAENEQTENGEAEQAPAGSGKRKLFIIIGAVVLLLGAGAGGYFMFFMFFAKKDHKVAEAPPPKPPVFIDMPLLLVKLSPAPGERPQYLKVKLVLEVKEAPQAALIQPNIPRVMDIFQTYLREVRPSDLNGSAGMFRLKEELTRRVNVAVAPTPVTAVLFKEILVQ